MMSTVIERHAGRDDAAARPTILTAGWLRGFRVSTVRRPDGSWFTVSVPSKGVAEGTEHLAPGRRWITGDGPPRPSDASLLALAAVVSGAGAGAESVAGKGSVAPVAGGAESRRRPVG
jgi:hypothetical protein